MNQPLTIKRTLHFSRQPRGRRRLEPGPAPAAEPQAVGRVPRVTRLMALAIGFEEQVRTGQLARYSQLAALGHVTRARVSQIMNLVNIAPEIQEALLNLPRTQQGRDPIILRGRSWSDACPGASLPDRGQSNRNTFVVG
jgi:hypothetical protein